MNKSPIAKAVITLLPQQQAVIEWVINDTGSLELVARAGCGKTFTLIEVVKTIARLGLGEFALMAYNRPIANELQAKIKRLEIDWKVGTANTVHAFGYSAWKKFLGVKDLPIDSDKVAKIVENLTTMADSHERQSFWIDNGPAIEKLVGYAKQRAVGYLCSVDDTAAWLSIWDHFGIEDMVSEQYYPGDVCAEAMNVLKRSFRMDREVIDFDDMILAPLVHKARFWKKDWILMDEAQDTNPARRALALAMLKPNGRMIIVGDDCQAIYGFTGADGDSMGQCKEALKKFGSVKSLPLNVTMRCPKAVVRQAQKLVPDITAHDSAPEGVFRALKYADLMKETLLPTDAIVCRNTAPLVTTAFSLIAAGIACKVEGRDIGLGLIKLAQRWKVKDLNGLLERLDDYQTKMIEKLTAAKKEAQLGALVDQLDCLRVIITRCKSQNKHEVADLVAIIKDMFGNTLEEAKQVLTLATGHKSKGREWPRVFHLGRVKFLPSPYAKKPWQQIQERNLEYVIDTRAQEELIDLEMAA